VAASDFSVNFEKARDRLARTAAETALGRDAEIGAVATGDTNSPR
jgi:hypothetical protein